MTTPSQRALLLYRRRSFINHLLTYLLTYLLQTWGTISQGCVFFLPSQHVIIIIIENMDVGIASKSTSLTTLINFLILKHKF